VTGAGEDFLPPRDEISPAQEQAMWEEIQRNIETLRSMGALAPLNTAQAVTYNFPLRMAPGLPDYAGFRVSAFADHNPASGPVLDYNGGARTYDGHRGTDYALYPFSWNKVDAGDVQVIAAAAHDCRLAPMLTPLTTTAAAPAAVPGITWRWCTPMGG
jgi:hypothetical protein